MSKNGKKRCLLSITFLMVAIAVANQGEKLPQSRFRPSAQSAFLFDRIAEATNSIRDLSAQVDIQVRLSSVGMTFNVGGEYFYKQPDKTSLKLRDVPEFLYNRQTDAFK